MTENGVKTGKGKHIFVWIACIVILLIPACAFPQACTVTALAVVLSMDNQDPMEGIPMPPPLPPMPNPNAMDYYSEAQKALVGIYNSDLKAIKAVDFTDKFGDFTLAEKELVLAQGATVDELIHQGFAYPCQVSAERSIFPMYSWSRNLARYLHFRRRVKAEGGDWGGSMNASIDCLRLGVDIQQNAPMTGMLTGISLEAIGRGGDFWETPKHLNKEQAFEAIKRLEEIIAKEPAYADVLREDKFSSQLLLLEVFRKEYWRPEYSRILTTGGEQERLVMSIILLGVNKRRIMREFTTYSDQLIARAELPYDQNFSTPKVSWLIRPLMGITERTRGKYIVNQTQNALLLVTLALQAYYLENGKYPSTLAELAPAYLQKVPDDPFAESGPLQYSEEGNKYRLYSIGPDGVDQGGKPITNDTKAKADLYTIFNFINGNAAGDIVPGVNVK